MQNHQINQNDLPSFKSISSKSMTLLNFIFGIFWLFFGLFFLAGMIFLLSNPSNETGLETTATVFLFCIFLFALVGFISVLIYFRKQMYTSTIIDEKGIRYLNKFNGGVVKDLPWNSFAKKEAFNDAFEIPRYDVGSNTPHKSLFDKFFWPVLINKKVTIHTDAFTGKHPFYMFYSNRSELIRTFLLGLAHYRPDLTIDPIIFTNHYIATDNYAINYRKRRLTAILGVLLFLFILGIVYYFVF